MTKVIFLSSISQSTGIEFLIIRMLKVNTFLRKLEVIKGLLNMTDNLPFKGFVDAPIKLVNKILTEVLLETFSSSLHCLYFEV